MQGGSRGDISAKVATGRGKANRGTAGKVARGEARRYRGQEKTTSLKKIGWNIHGGFDKKWKIQTLKTFSVHFFFLSFAFTLECQSL